MTYTVQDSHNRGFIARMNHLKRVPANDSRFIQSLNTSGVSKWNEHLQAWISGWDEANLEYLNTPNK
jgi:hypothetical protein